MDLDPSQLTPQPFIRPVCSQRLSIENHPSPNMKELTCRLNCHASDQWPVCLAAVDRKLLTANSIWFHQVSGFQAPPFQNFYAFNNLKIYPARSLSHWEKACLRPTYCDPRSDP